MRNRKPHTGVWGNVGLFGKAFLDECVELSHRTFELAIGVVDDAAVVPAIRMAHLILGVLHPPGEVSRIGTAFGEPSTQVIVRRHYEDAVRILELLDDLLCTLGVENDDRGALLACFTNIGDARAVEVAVHFRMFDELLLLESLLELLVGEEVVGDAIHFAGTLLAGRAGDDARHLGEVDEDLVGQLRLARGCGA